MSAVPATDDAATIPARFVHENTRMEERGIGRGTPSGTRADARTEDALNWRPGDIQSETASSFNQRNFPRIIFVCD